MPQKELSASGFQDLFFGPYVGLNIGAYIITNASCLFLFFGGGRLLILFIVMGPKP